MSSCINKNTVEFQTLLKKSGTSEFYLSYLCAEFIDNYGRFPHLDEIDGADSLNFLEEKLKIKNGYTTISNIQQLTGRESIKESQIWLNDNFRDKEIQIIPLTQDAKIQVLSRPITKPIQFPQDHTNTNGILLLEQSIQKLKEVYGLPIETNYDSTKLTSTKDGIVYVNPLAYDISLPVSSIAQLLSSSINNSAIYKQLVSLFTEQGLQDEIYKLVTGQQSQIPDQFKYEIIYNMKRNLDSILMGESSVKQLNVFNLSIQELAKEVNSSIDNSTHNGTQLDEVLKDRFEDSMDNVTEYCNV